MTPIRFPLKPRQRRIAVVHVQDALQQLLARAVIPADDEVARQRLAAALESERVKITYGSATQRAVRAFQAAHRLEAHGEIDEATTNALNELLQPSEELPSIFRSPLYEGAESPGGTLVQEILVRPVPGGARARGAPLREEHARGGLVLAKAVRSAVDGYAGSGGTPVPGLRVLAIDRNFRAEQTLGDVSTDDSGRYRIAYRSRAFARVTLVHQILTSRGLFVRAA